MRHRASLMRPRVTVEPLEVRALMSGNPWSEALGGRMEPMAAATAPDGSVIVVGTRNAGGPVNELAVARLTPRATLDTTFGVNGVAAARWNGIYNSASDVVITAEGKILVAGFAQVMGPAPGDMSDFGVARFNADGTLDTTFGGGDGLVTLNLSAGLEAGADSANVIALDADGRIVVAGGVNYRLPGTSTFTGDFALARLNDDGSPDTTFGSDGQVITLLAQPQSGPQCSATDLHILEGGQILATGYRGGPTGEVTSARYNADGSLDGAYGDGGILYGSEPYVAPGIDWSAVAEAPAPTVAASVQRAVARTPVVRHGAFFRFNVTYASQSGASIDLSTLGDGDLTVSGPGGYDSPAELVRAKARRRGTVVKATYRAAAPGGRFDRSDNGRYSLRLAASAVTGVGDSVGTGAACEVGAFLVQCSPPPAHGFSTFRITETIFS
jgi:uncharacterized delta-60 repeat protein